MGKANEDLGPLDNLSVVELEAAVRDAWAEGDEVTAEACETELAGRTWLHHNPYAEVEA